MSEAGYKVQPGALGEHERFAFHCGDGLAGLKSLPDNSVDLVLTDVPYGEVNEQAVKSNAVEGSMRNNFKAGADVLTFDLMEFVDQCARVACSAVYIWCGFEQISPIITRMRSKELDLTVRLLPWEKTNPSPLAEADIFPSQFEFCVYGRLPGAYHHNKEAGRGAYLFPSGSAKKHPTQKPLALFERQVLTSCPIGGIVCDPCSGYGTAGKAAMKLGRRFIGWELDPYWHAQAHIRISDAADQGDLFFDAGVGDDDEF